MSRPGQMALRAPEALEDGEVLSGPIMCKFPTGKAPPMCSRWPSPASVPIPPETLPDPSAVLTVRDHSERPHASSPATSGSSAAWKMATLSPTQLLSTSPPALRRASITHSSIRPTAPGDRQDRWAAGPAGDPRQGPEDHRPRLVGVVLEPPGVADPHRRRGQPRPRSSGDHPRLFHDRYPACGPRS